MSVESIATEGSDLLIQVKNDRSNKLAAGDLLRLNFTDGRFVFLAVDKVGDAPSSPPFNGALLEARATRSVWFWPLQPIDDPVSAVNVTVGEVYGVTVPIIRRIAEEVRSTLTELPAEVAGDIYDRGLILTGGGALLPGLAQYLQKEIGLTVMVADEPRLAIVRGLAQMYDEPLLLRRVARTEAHPLIDMQDAILESYD